MDYAYLVMLLMLMEYTCFGYLVSRARSRCKVPAPAVTGNEEFERYYRVQQNTLEQLIVTLPALWIFALTSSPLWASLGGLLFILGRAVYAWGYIQSPPQRHHGFVLGAAGTAALVIGAFWGVLKGLL